MNKPIALIFVLFFLLALSGCSNRSIKSEPNITGIVKSTTDRAILIENEDSEYLVSLEVENKDSVTEFNVGDEVVVYYDGNIKETYPALIDTVYAITLKTPADKAENNQS